MSALESWQEEKQSAWLYRVLAEVESEPGRQKLFRALSDAAEVQAGIWDEQLRREEREPSPYVPDWRSRIVALLLRRLGPRRMRRVLAAMKVRGMSVYERPVSGDHPWPTRVEEVGLHHRGAGQGGTLRAAVFGVNDGLVSNTSLIMGVAGAFPEPGPILTAGVAGLLAGALSMAAGEYVSMRSQREFFEFQIGLERDELKRYPAEEAEELALIYHARGLPLEQARTLSTALMRNPEHALDTLAREELGLNPDDLGSPWGAAASSFAAFTGGAMIPLLPFLIGLGVMAIPVAAGLAGLGLFCVGALLSLFTGRGALSGGLRMVLIGGMAAMATYGIGVLLGVSLA